MPTLLLVHHTVSPYTQDLLEACLSGAAQVPEVTARTVPALTASAHDALSCDAYLLLCPANLGSLAGAMKHFFDTIYYPCLQSTAGRPWALVVHGNDDCAGAITLTRRITTGLRWREHRPPLAVTGAPTGADREACWELAATLAAGITQGSAGRSAAT